MSTERKMIAGVDIGNSTTEAALGTIDINGRVAFLASAIRPTTGIKGTEENVHGIRLALETALAEAGAGFTQLSEIRLNEAAPVMAGTAMETVTETVVTNSAMLGHNPDTPAGAGHAMGILRSIRDLEHLTDEQSILLLVPGEFGYEKTAALVNAYAEKLRITGLILEKDEGVLVENRLNQQIPIVDEVRELRRVPEGKTAAIEVAPMGESISMLSNPYGIATLLDLTPEETKAVLPIAKSLVGHSSAVVIKTPTGKVTEQKRPAGKIVCISQNRQAQVDVADGADAIMHAFRSISENDEIIDITGEPDTCTGIMLEGIRHRMASLTGDSSDNIHISGILAVDTVTPMIPAGSIAGETYPEKAVAIAAMVKVRKLPMEKLARALETEIQKEIQKGAGTAGTLSVHIKGVEAVMALLGALTTPGVSLPLAVLDLGGGSTDAAAIDEECRVRSVHRAGAGELVTALIASELGVERNVAEQLKRWPLAKVESLFHIRLENGEIKFFQSPLEPKFFGRVVLLQDGEMANISCKAAMERIRMVRREAKAKVFVPNARDALTKIAADHNIKRLPHVVLVGGSAEDFEIPAMLMEAFAKDGIVCGRGNIRKTEGPRNAVATGLVISALL